MGEQSFSAGYVLVPGATVTRRSDELAQMDSLLYERLAQMFGEPVVGKVGKLHYQFKPTAGFSDGRTVVPRRNHDRDPETLLIRK